VGVILWVGACPSNQIIIVLVVFGAYPVNCATSVLGLFFREVLGDLGSFVEISGRKFSEF
jgi:hypothetical protein